MNSNNMYRHNNLIQFVKNAEIKEGEKLLILMRGVSGSGKTHKAKTLVDRMGGVIFSTDDFPGLYQKAEEGKIPKIYQEKITEAHKWNQSNVISAMQSGLSPIIVDSTNIRAWEMKPYVEVAKEYGYHYKMENPDSPWWNSLFKKDMSPAEKEKLIDILYEKTQHIPKPENPGDPDPIRKMLEGWEYEPSEEEILKSRYPWEDYKKEEEEENTTEDKEKTAIFNIRESSVVHMPGHKNSNGESSPWVIKSHETGKILSSHKSESEARQHLQDMHIHGGSFLGIRNINALINNE